MSGIVEDAWIDEQTRTHDLAELQDCSVAIDASYYLHFFLSKVPYHEPLLPALGGLTGIESHIEKDLNDWDTNKVVPFFIFDGQQLSGQDVVASQHGILIHPKTDAAWELYFDGKATDAVSAFGAIGGVWRPQALYPMLKRILKRRGIHFLVAPFNASAQLAHFDMIDSDQCAAIMGSQELLLYPISDTVIQSIDWERKSVTSLSKKGILRTLNVSEPMFIDALLMTGTAFLPPFPPLQDRSIYRENATVMDAVNVLRTSDKLVDTACASFNDILQTHDPDWLDKYRKARMAVNHFIYISESGEPQVNDFEHLTKDNHEYLGLQLPAELFHYLNTGLIGERIPAYISHGQVVIQPTLDGFVSAEYRKLVTSQIVPILEMALGLVVPRLHRGICHKEILLKVWFDPKFNLSLGHRSLQPPPASKVASWNVKESDIAKHFPRDFAGPIAFEVVSLLNPDLAKSTISKAKLIKDIDSAETITSIVIWRFLHLRGYVKDDHTLTRWGTALATSLVAVKDSDDSAVLSESVLLAFELIRFELLNGKNRHEELCGLPLKGSEEDKTSLLLLARCATLIKLRHQTNGYTGPLNKNLLAFRSLSCTVRDADRDLVEAILASMFMYGQSKRERDDAVEIYERLPFLNAPDIAMGIAVKTFLDDAVPGEQAEAKAARIESFRPKFLPYATNFVEDLEICWSLFDALVKGVNTLDKEMSTADKQVWDTGASYLDARR